MVTSTLPLACEAGGARLVGRPSSSVAHAYVGSVTPSGRWVPRGGRTVCGVRTRRLRVLSGVARGDTSDGRRGCLRCWARIASRRAQQPRTRDAWARLFVGVTAYDVAVAAYRARTREDVELLEFIALLLVGWPAVHTDDVVSPWGKTTRPLGKQLATARLRVGARRDPLTPGLRAAADENAMRARDLLKQRKHDAWREREDRIARLGFVNATTRPA